MFPLNSVSFPGAPVPLRVFEPRYRALVRALLAEPEPRWFGTVAIREGYEVGERAAASLFRIGTRLEVAELRELPDGGFQLLAVGRDRLILHHLDVTGPYPVGSVEPIADDDEEVPTAVVHRARWAYQRYRELIGAPVEADLPADPTALGWTLAGRVPLPLRERQGLLEATDPASRLIILTDLIEDEVRAIRAIPSLPATEVARHRFSPN